MPHRTSGELAAGLDQIRRAPRGRGTVDLIVARPAVDERVVLLEASLDPVGGLLGDTWLERGSSRTPDGSANADAQLTLMSSRAAAVIAGPRERWPLAGDQVYIDLDLSEEALPAGSQVAIGTSVIEISATPHTGCAKFSARFGSDALRFVNTGEGRLLRLRGVNARILTGGTIRPGDAVIVLTGS